MTESGQNRGIRLGPYYFRPGLALTFFVVLMAAVMLRLGVWQLDRAEEKRQILADYEARMAAPPVDLNAMVPHDDMEYYRVVARGEFDTAHQLLLDNRVHQGVPGYQVLTPYRIGDVAVLVNRGWVPGTGYRDRLPAIPLDQVPDRIRGRVKIPSEPVFEMTDAVAFASGWPKVVQYVNPAAMSKELGYDLLPYVVLMDAELSGGFIRDWPVINMQPAKHTSYAIQWFGLVLVLLVVYVLVGLRRPGMQEDDNEHTGR
jgi:surfeit locus 1 family protein